MTDREPADVSTPRRTTPATRNVSTRAISIGLVAAMVLAACSRDADPGATSTDTAPDRAAAEGDSTTVLTPSDPAQLPALPGGSATGPQYPIHTGAVLGPRSWVSSSLAPTLEVPGADGAWTFTVDDLGGGQSDFGPLVYASSANTTAIPIDAGLRQGQIYTWTAESPGQDPVGGSFQVDIQLNGVQHTDTMGGVSVALSSGEASYTWSSHAMGSVGGAVGISLHYARSSRDEAGVPAGWNLIGASSGQYTRIEIHDDASIALVANNGAISNYLPSGELTYSPIELAGATPAVIGLAPVVTRDADGDLIVTTKDSTSIFADPDGDGIAELVGIAAGGQPVLQQQWSGGLLRSIADPVSGRAITLDYGGADTCPAPPDGFVPAPADHLCQVRFWDGTASQFFYVEAPDTTITIGRFVSFPSAGIDALVTDIAYDAAGRITRTRSPLVSAAAAAGLLDAMDQQYWTEVTYDDAGRAVSLIGPAPSPGATRCERAIAYVSAEYTSVADSCFGGQVSAVRYDPSTFFPLELTNSAGQRSTYAWDLDTGHVDRLTDYSGLSIAYTYDGGRLVETIGPTLGDGGQITRREYDQFVDSAGETEAMSGLDVDYWPSATDTTLDQIQELGPRLGGAIVPSLTVNWAESPAGNDGDWSALMTGAIVIETAGTYRFAASGAITALHIDNTLCELDRCSALDLGAGPHQIRIDVASPTPEATMSITWAGPDTGGEEVSIPTDRLIPQYGYATTTRLIDPNAVRSVVENRSHTRYDDPATGRVSARVNQAELLSATQYGASWERQSAAVLPGGNRYGFDYWGDQETATSPCAGATAINQGGAARSGITPLPGQPATTQWHDEAGRAIAQQFADGAVTCTTYDAIGRVASVELLGMDTTYLMVNEYRIDGDPLRSRTTTTIGERTYVATSQIDILGRRIASSDHYGVTSTIAYDERTGKVATVATTIPAGPSARTIVQANVYDERGWLVAVNRDGRVLAEITYTPNGVADTIVYGDGTEVRATYDDQLRAVDLQWNLPGGQRYESARQISAAGHVSEESFGVDGVSSVFTYTNDDAGRLIAAELSAGLVDAPRTWAYSYDDNSNRLTQTVDGTTYTYTYNDGDQLVATDDPAAAAGIAYDGRGNATQIGDNTFTYDAANRLVGATDGTTTVSYVRDVSGAVLERTVSGPDGTDTVGISAMGITFDADGIAVAQAVSLPGEATYTEWFAGEPAARWQYTSVNGDLFFTTDDTGTPVGTPQLYDPFGQVLTTPDPPEPGVLDLTWQAAQGNETIALASAYVLMGARVYVPALGRFVQQDPQIGGSANGYDFANQNPVNVADPEGAAAVDWGIFIVVNAVLLAVSLVVPPAEGIVVGAMVGVLYGTAGYLLTYGLQTAVGEEPQFSLGQLFTTIASSMAFSGLFGWIQWVKATRPIALRLGYAEEDLGFKFLAKNASDIRSASRLYDDFGYLATRNVRTDRFGSAIGLEGDLSQYFAGQYAADGAKFLIAEDWFRSNYQALVRLTGARQPEVALLNDLEHAYSHYFYADRGSRRWGWLVAD